MDIDNTRLYDIPSAAAVLDCTISWLRDQVTAGTVPHGRRGKRKGVFFTADDLNSIIEDRRRPARPIAAPKGTSASAAHVLLVAVPERFAGLRSARA